MAIITKVDMKREVLVDDFGVKLGVDYLLETMANTILRNKELHQLSIEGAIAYLLVDLSVSDYSYHEELLPVYEKNIDLFKVIGFKAGLNMSLRGHIIDTILNECVDTIGLAVAKSYLYARAKSEVKYVKTCLDFVNTMTPSAYDTIGEMLEDVVLGLAISEVVENEPCIKIDKPSRPEVRVIILDDATEDLDMLSIIKLINGGNLC